MLEGLERGEEYPGAQILLESSHQGSEGKVGKGRGGAAFPLTPKTDLMLAELGDKGSDLDSGTAFEAEDVFSPESLFSEESRDQQVSG